ncbi:hypothetical protein PybrP1_008450 [[Pythium] brassicae (nom. inval.)]|nr:hypothetical protein PybrP1_008450 [[Pythium] brassicae (nom. inval.)]
MSTARQEQRYHSHSSHRGRMTEALSHSGVSVTEVIPCGGWPFEMASRVFLYFSGMKKGDMRVGSGCWVAR